MSLWDPEAAGNAAIYLRLSNEEMCAIRNKAGLKIDVRSDPKISNRIKLGPIF